MIFAYKIFPAFVLYTDRFIGDKFSGKVFGNIILIRPSKKHEVGLLEHELIHVKQFYRTLGLHGLFYKLSKKYRLKCEIEAYRETIRCKGYKTKSQSYWIVESLLNNYNLSTTQEEIEKLLYI